MTNSIQPLQAIDELASLEARARRIGMRFFPYGVGDVAKVSAMLDWAEEHRLRGTPTGVPSVEWLLGGRGHRVRHRRRSWMDHSTGWIRNRRPAVLVSQPYGITEEGIKDLAGLTDEGLTVRIDGTGWYGCGTTFIEVWAPGCEAFPRNADVTQ